MSNTMMRSVVLSMLRLPLFFADPCQPYAAPKTATSSPLAGKESAASWLASSVWS
jgi:hypothetical protein